MPSSDTQMVPASAPGPSQSNLWPILGVSFSVTAALIISWVGFFVFPQFSEVYANFGADLPRATALMLRFFLLIWLLPALVVLTWLFAPGPRHRRLFAGLLGVFGAVISIPLVILLIYLPILQLASVTAL